jgi:uncharacterized protein
MRQLLTLFLFSLSISLFAQQGLPVRPNPPRLVNDLTGNTLTDSQVARLENKLLAYEDTTSTQVAILMVNSLNGYEVVDYAQRVGQNWGVGQANKDNGVFIVVAIQDRKAAIVTGYGMEGSITDAATYTIREDYMNPRFQEGNFYAGLDDATDAIFSLASGEFTADQMAKRRSRSSDGKGRKGFPFGFLFILFFFILPAIAGRKRRRGIGSRGIPWWAWLMMGSGGSSSRRDNNWDNFRGGGGGFGGFGGGGGGFGGFGGGSFGGGGSGGSW